MNLLLFTRAVKGSSGSFKAMVLLTESVPDTFVRFAEMAERNMEALRYQFIENEVKGGGKLDMFRVNMGHMENVEAELKDGKGSSKGNMYVSFSYVVSGRYEVSSVQYDVKLIKEVPTGRREPLAKSDLIDKALEKF